MARSVLVTAGASGIGGYIARTFHNLGDHVHVVDVDESALAQIENTGHASITTQADVSSEVDIDRVFKHHFEKLNGIDVLVNCAGIAGPTAMVEDIALSDWQRCLAVNLDATFLCCRKAAPVMKKQRHGRIINISSTAGWHGYPLRSPYASAKWAVIGLTKSLAMELGQFRVTANVICPGSVDGERMDRVISIEAKKRGVSEDEVRSSYTQSCSMRRFISGQDIADMAAFLASDQACKVTGQAMNVDGHLESYAGLDDLGIDDERFEQDEL